MSVYDQAHALARSIRESDEFKSYKAAKDAAYENETNKALLDEYKRLQFQLQVAMAGGGSADPEDMERFQKIAGLFQYSPEATAYMMAEIQLQRMLGDIYKILGEAADINLDFLQR